MKHPLYLIAYYWRKYVSAPYHAGQNAADLDRALGKS